MTPRKSKADRSGWTHSPASPVEATGMPGSGVHHHRRAVRDALATASAMVGSPSEPGGPFTMAEKAQLATTGAELTAHARMPVEGA